MITTFLAANKNYDLSSPTITLTLVLWAMYAGLVIACAMSVYNKNYPGAVVRALIKKECLSPEGAMTLGELGIKPSALRRRTMRDKATIRKYVAVANPEACRRSTPRSGAALAVRRFLSMDTSDVVTYDFDTARFYIPEDKKHVADVRYGTSSKLVPGIITVVAAAVLGAALVLALMHFIPEILEMVDDVVDYFKSIGAQ